MEVVIRKTLPEDAYDYTLCHIACWQAAYRGIIPDAFLNKMPGQIAERTERCQRALENPGDMSYCCAMLDGQMIGRLIFGRSRDEDKPEAGEIGAIYLTGAHWGKGYGKAMMDFALDALGCGGYRDVLLWVLEENSRARRFYERCGFVPDGAAKVVEDFGKPLKELRYAQAI